MDGALALSLVVFEKACDMLSLLLCMSISMPKVRQPIVREGQTPRPSAHCSSRCDAFRPPCG